MALVYIYSIANYCKPFARLGPNVMQFIEKTETIGSYVFVHY